MPEVKVILTPDELNDSKIENEVMIVIDTLRASTTIVSALASGIKAILPFSTEAALRNYYKNEEDRAKYILAGEFEGKRIKGFDLGNSPLPFANNKFRKRIMLLKTSNGTKVLDEIGKSNLILIGGLVNSKKIVSVILDKEDDVYLVCAGSNGAFSLEDFFAAGRYCYLLRNAGWQGDDLTVAAARIYEDNSKYEDIVNLFYHSRNGQNLLDLGYEKDIEFSSKIDIFDIAPIFDGEKIIRKKN